MHLRCWPLPLILLAGCTDNRPRLDIHLSIDASSVCRIEGNIVPCNAAGNILAKTYPNTRITAMIAANHDAHYQELANLIKSLKEAGINSIGLITQP